MWDSKRPNVRCGGFQKTNVWVWEIPEEKLGLRDPRNPNFKFV